MSNKRTTHSSGWLVGLVGALLVACAPTAPPPADEHAGHDHAEKVGEAASAAFTNGGFESGTNNNPPPDWTVTTNLGVNNTGVTIPVDERSDLNLQSGGVARTVTLVTAAGPESQTDATLGTAGSLRWPKFGNAVALVNQQGDQRNVNSMKQTMTVAAGDIDSVDGLAHVRFVIAPVLQDPGHPSNQQPYFFVQLTNLSKGNAVLYQDFNFANQPGVPWKANAANTVRYTDWALVDIAPGSAALNVGDQVELEVIAGGCSQGGHWGQVYVDSVGSTVPGLFVSATGPAAANQNTDITYTLNYKNGGTAGASGVVVEFNTPPNTTFTSFNAPGLTCTPPAGPTGLLTCTIPGTLAAGAGGSFQVTVHINNGTAGQVITAGNYDIDSPTTSPLIGPKVYTSVTSGVTYADLGVTVTDGATQVAWGQTGVAYTVTVNNAGPNAVTGATVSDPVPPNLTGMTWTCAASGGATCPAASGSGALNQTVNVPVNGTLTYTVTGNVVSGSGVGTLFNVATVTLPSGAVDPSPANNSAGDSDVIKGANGNPCATGNECISNTCSPNGLICVPAGGCGADADCNTATQFCNTQTYTCTTKLANGTAVPTISGHTPVLDGQCSTAVGTAVCQSGNCSVTADVCIPAGGCAVDADCTSAQFCNTQTLTCTPKLANGTAMPTITGHTPTLDGQCTTAAGTAVCVSGNCSVTADICIPAGGCAVDSECTSAQFCNTQTLTCTPKLANGTAVPTISGHTPVLDGQCSTAVGTAVCQSGNCSVTADICIPAGGCAVDSECTSAQFCNTQTLTCTPKLANGTAVPTISGHTPVLNGQCSTAVGTAVCQSGACSVTADICIPAGGCAVDSECTSAQFCNTQTLTCTPKLANGTAVPTISGHTPVLNGQCSTAVGTAVCQSGACSVTADVCIPAGGCAVDSECTSAQFCNTQTLTCTPKLANGTAVPTISGHTPVLNGQCSTAVGTAVCQSGACSVTADVCIPAGGCAVDSECTSAQFCNTQTLTCTPKLPNGTAVPTISGHTPVLDGQCTTAVGTAVCQSGACSVTADVCIPAGGCAVDADCTSAQFCNTQTSACTPKLPNGTAVPTIAGHTPVLDGQCTTAVGTAVCQSGNCSVTADVCIPAGGCAVDADCTSAQFCNTQTLTCTPKLANGTAMPTITGHTPTLDGQCTTAAGTAVCVSGNCSVTADICIPAGGCAVDSECTSAQFCNTQTFTCTAKLPSGTAIPTIGGHTPTLDGQCSTAAGTAVCQSGNCSPTADICIPANGCAVDSECTSAEFCNTQTFACTPKLPNGTSVPTIGGHTPPLTGTCTAGAGAAVCVAGVCDTADNACGYANGHGPCDMSNGATVCRSGVCSASGTCMAPGSCNADADCTGGDWCNISAHACTPKIGNGGVMPTDPPHASPTLDGDCTTPAAALVCVSAVCDASDDRCGYANGNGTCDAASAATVCRSEVCDPDGKCGLTSGVGPCTSFTGPVICRSGVCSPNGAVCMPVGGCAVDADCGASEWCETPTFTCQPKLPNGTAIPTVAGHDPTLDGTCSAGAGAAVCASAVCDPGDDLCGLADGSGPCTAATGAVVCRSGSCTASGVCGPATGCDTDSECDTTTQFCDTGVHACSPKLPNGAAMPTVAGHTPALDGDCDTTQAPIVCVSAVCDDADDRCGFANGHGPCTEQNAGVVCRSSTCSPNGGVCVPSGGCAVDADCGANEWCNTELFACAPKLPNGQGVPTVAGHAPVLDGTCTTAVGASVCVSAVCDTSDDKCGYANGNGPCTMANAGVVCREGACTTGGVCTTPADCTADADCDTQFQYCDTGVGKCAPKKPNGALMPGVQNHSPALDGTCSDTAAQIVCQSGVCDPEDNKCGHANGQGPCDSANGATVCRSAICAQSGPNSGLCVECAANADCEGSQAVCDTAKNECVQCTPAEDDACTGATPVCVPGPGTCAPCDGDLGSSAAHACTDAAAPYCFLTGLHEGECGKCTVNADCQGHPGGPFCDATSGACVEHCSTDADCQATEWCNAPAGGQGSCVPKLDNGEPLPASPSEVKTCTDAVGKRVCKSGVCDTTDDKCGLANGDGPCADGTVCRSGVCDPTDKKCGLDDGNGPCSTSDVCRSGECDTTKQICAGGCKSDAECKSSEFCAEDGECKTKLEDGKACTRDTMCKSDTCHDKVCDSIVGQGNGVICAASPRGDRSGEGAVVTLLGLALAGLARRRRR